MNRPLCLVITCRLILMILLPTMALALDVTKPADDYSRGIALINANASMDSVLDGVLLIFSAAKAEDSRAQLFLAEIFAHGKPEWELEQDTALALTLLEASATSGLAEAQHLYGLVLYTGTPHADAAPEAGRQWMEQAAAQGWAEAMMTLADLDQQRGEAGASTAWMRRAAEAGYAPAYAEVIRRYGLGYGVAPDVMAGMDIVFQRARLGDGNALYALGHAFYFGEHDESEAYPGLPRNPKAALDMFNAAAEQQHPVAMYMLGMMHYSGDGTPSNEAVARNWLQKSLAQGYTQAADLLAYFDSLR